MIDLKEVALVQGLRCWLFCTREYRNFVLEIDRIAHIGGEWEKNNKGKMTNDGYYARQLVVVVVVFLQIIF